MTFLTHAQNFEDVLLWRTLYDVERGQYLDIGAQDPVADSVSLIFYEAGWRGIHVEPTPTYAARLREARPDETVFEVAIATSSGPMDFYEIPETGLSTGMAEFADRHSQSGFEKRKILVPSMRLDELLGSVDGDLHWMKIDVEGMEGDVLKSWGDHPLRPWILVIEATFPNSQEPSEHLWIDEVRRRGYCEAHFDGLSRYFVHEDRKHLAGRLGAPPNVFDGFHVTSTHFSAGTLNEKFRAELEDICGQAKQREGQIAEELAIVQLNLEATSKQVTEIQTDRLQLAEALAASEREYRSAIDLVWRERNELETRLREQLSDLEKQARKDASDLAALHERSIHQQARIEDSQSETAEAKERVSSLENELLVLQSSLSRANKVMSEALAEPVGRWQRLGQAFALSREDGARRAILSWFVNSPIPPILDVSMPLSTGEARNPYLRANSLPELLAWDDLNFVRCAYVTMLGRQPDPVGEAYYASRLRSGRSKREILWQLRKSFEGRRHDPGIAGLDRSLKAARWQRLIPFRGFRQKVGLIAHADRHAVPAIQSDRLRVIEIKIDALQRSLNFLEGAALKGAAIEQKQKPDLTAELFKRNLAVVAEKIERNQK